MHHRLPVLLSFLLFCFLTTALHAQQAHSKNKILQELNRDQPGQGRVRIYEDENITGIVGRSMAPPRPIYTTPDGSMQYYKMRGYKIQVFSGNNQRTSRAEATRKKQLIEHAFPEHEAVVLFESPFWRLRVGNFEKREEAEKVMKEIAGAFPSFGREMYVVVDEVKIPVHPAASNENEGD